MLIHHFILIIFPANAIIHLIFLKLDHEFGVLHYQYHNITQPQMKKHSSIFLQPRLFIRKYKNKLDEFLIVKCQSCL